MKNKIQVKEVKRNNQGITLIALIITIIVLLILAGISIASLTGDNGFLSKASTAKDATKQEEGREIIRLAIEEMRIEKLEKGEKLTLDYIGDFIHEKLKIEKEDVTKNGDPTETVDVIYNDYEYEIDDHYQITLLGSTKGRVTITALYEKTGNTGIIYVTAQTEDEKGIRRIIKPDGTIQEYTNQEKEVSISYPVTQSGSYKFMAEGNNDSKRSKTVIVNDLDYFAVTFDQTSDFLTIENAYLKSKETLSAEQNEILSEASGFVENSTLCGITGQLSDLSLTLLGISRDLFMNDYYLYDRYSATIRKEYVERNLVKLGTNIKSRFCI